MCGRRHAFTQLRLELAHGKGIIHRAFKRVCNAPIRRAHCLVQAPLPEFTRIMEEWGQYPAYGRMYIAANRRQRARSRK